MLDIIVQRMQKYLSYGEDKKSTKEHHPKTPKGKRIALIHSAPVNTDKTERLSSRFNDHNSRGLANDFVQDEPVHVEHDASE